MGNDGYTGFAAAGNVTGWGYQANDLDVPRYYQMIRNGLLNTTAIWTTMNGSSYYYAGLGDEMGYDQSPYSNGISIIEAPYEQTMSAATTTTIIPMDEILTESWGPGFYRHVPANTNTTIQGWYAKPWRGEIYPDCEYSAWQTIGNLPTVVQPKTNFASPATLQFYREECNAITVPATNPSRDGFGRHLGDATDADGCGSFFLGTDGAGNIFQHNSGSSGLANELSLASTCYSIFQFPLSNPVSVMRFHSASGRRRTRRSRTGRCPGSRGSWRHRDAAPRPPRKRCAPRCDTPWRQERAQVVQRQPV